MPYNYKGLFKGEGVGISILEAMAAGKAVITTLAPGIERAIINEKTGLVVDQGDIEGLSNAILELLRNPEKSNRIGKAGFELVKSKFSIKEKIKEYEMVYEYLFQKFNENSVL